MSKSDVTGEVSYKKVVNTFIRQTDEIYNVKFENASILETTWNHPFRRLKTDGVASLLLDRGQIGSMDLSEWREARDLKKGDQVYSADGSLLVVESVIIEQREETVYNFEVEDFHTYFVGEDGVWVHNDECSGNNTTALVESLVKCGSISGSCANEIFEKHKEFSRIDAKGQAIGGAIGLTALTCVALCGPVTYSIATSRLGQILGLSTPAVNLGYKEFVSKGGNGGIAAESVFLNGTKLTLKNFTIQSTKKGADLIGPANHLLNYAKEVGAKQITLRGSFSSNQLLEKYGRKVFEETIPATREGIVNALRKMSEIEK